MKKNLHHYEGNYAIRIYGGKQTERQTDRQSLL